MQAVKGDSKQFGQPLNPTLDLQNTETDCVDASDKTPCKKDSVPRSLF